MFSFFFFFFFFSFTTITSESVTHTSLKLFYWSAGLHLPRTLQWVMTIPQMVKTAKSQTAWYDIWQSDECLWQTGWGKGETHRGTTVKFYSLKFNQRWKLCRVPEGTPWVRGGHSEIYGSQVRVFPLGAHLKLCEVKRVHKEASAE